ncbi:MAG: hypothetical protein WC378_15130 [Opitutaceae bacterium]|jgi:hypothetical protein
MQTGKITSSIRIGGISFGSTIERFGEGIFGQIPPIPAGVAGAISAAGVDGLAEGHGFEAEDVVDVHWTEDGEAKCARGLTVGVAEATEIEWDAYSSLEGDALPDEDTEVVVSKQVTINKMSFDGTSVEMIAAKCTKAAVVDFRTDEASKKAAKLIAEEAWSYYSGQEGDNPLTGVTITRIGSRQPDDFSETSAPRCPLPAPITTNGVGTMKSFRDAKDREWTISLTIGSAMRIRDKLKVDLLQPEQGTPPLMTRLGTDEMLLAEILLALMEGQFEKNEMTEQDVMNSFDGKTFLAAQTALYDELSDFFQSRGRADRAAAMKKQSATIQKAIQTATEKIEALDIDEVIHGVTSGSSPEPSESTPDP